MLILGGARGLLERGALFHFSTQKGGLIGEGGLFERGGYIERIRYL